MKKIVLFLSRIGSLEFKKITFLLPIYLQKKYGYETYVVAKEWITSDHFDEYRGVKIVVDSDPNSNFFSKNDNVVLFISIGPSWSLLPMVDKIKALSPCCKFVLFCDASKIHICLGEKIKRIILFPFTIRTYLLERKLGKGLYRRFDFLHCFTTYEYSLLCKRGILHYPIKDKLSIFPCGYDDEMFDQEINKPCKKENVILYTGRIGVYPKNHEIIFSLLTMVNDWKNWKIVFVGSSSEEYKKIYKSFMKQNPQYTNTFIILDPIYDSDKLYNYYRKSKVFLLTSITETLNFSVVEAALFDNYLISTNVGIVPEITENGKNCSVFRWNDLASLSSTISKLINGELDYEDKIQKVKTTIINDFKYSVIVERNPWFNGEN